MKNTPPKSPGQEVGRVIPLRAGLPGQSIINSKTIN
jgi:hypothetical protein